MAGCLVDMSFCMAGRHHSQPILDEVFRQSLRVEYVDADIAPLSAGHTTGWRVLPCLMFSQAHSGSERILLPDGRHAEAAKGEAIVLPPGVRHKVDVTTRRESRYWAHINCLVLDGLDLFSVIQAPLHLGRGLGRYVGEAIGGWVEERPDLEETPLALAARRQELAARLLFLLAPVCKVRRQAAHRIEGARRLGPVLQHMQAHLADSVRRDDLARAAGLSAAQFHVVFRQNMGVSPGKYLQTLRLRRAQQLLISTALPVKKVANTCGYADPFVFCKFFKRLSGYSPTEYRMRTMAIMRRPLTE